MKKFMDWVTNKFTPKMNKLARNSRIASIQEVILTAMPMISIGSFTTILTAFGGLVNGLPDFSPLSTFLLGLPSLYLAYLMPYLLMEKKRHDRTEKEAGLTGIGFFLMLVDPAFDETGNILSQSPTLGSDGMITALMAGLFVGFVMSAFSTYSFSKEDSAIPSFITVRFDTLIPILIILLVGWLFTLQLHINIFNCIYTLFSPILSTSDSFLGFVVLYSPGYTSLYTFGTSTWVIYPTESALILQGIVVNQAAVAAGNAASVINADGVSYYSIPGGGGCTLTLELMMPFIAKSKKCKVIGKTSSVPDLYSINEPLYLVHQSHLVRL